MRILLTGGSGFIGSAVADALTKRRDDVVIVSRSRQRGDVTWEALAAEVERADAVVHLAGEPIADERWTPARLERIRASRIDSTSLIAAAIERSARKPSVWVSGSAVGLYGTGCDGRVLDESAPPGDDILARICVAWEAAAEPARTVGVRVVHPRMGIVLGRGAGALAKMAWPFERFVGGPLGSGKQWMSWIHQHDVVRALLFVIDRESIAGPVNVVGPEPATMDEFARTLGRALRRPAAMRVPALALRLALGEGLAEMLLTGQRAVPSKLMEAGFTFQFTRLADALGDLYPTRDVSR